LLATGLLLLLVAVTVRREAGFVALAAAAADGREVWRRQLWPKWPALMVPFHKW